MPFIELQSVDSTNNYAFGRIRAGMAQPNEAIFSHEQFAGKGQRGKEWLTEKGANLCLSIIVKHPPLLLTEQFQLSVCAALSSFDLVKKYGGDETKMKWPNDIYWRDRKAGGILIESVIGSSKSVKIDAVADTVNSNTWLWAVVGIGLNINQTTFSQLLSNPVSLKQITGKNFSCIDLAHELHESFLKKMALLKEKKFEELFNRYKAELYKKEEPVKFRKGNRLFEATVKDVLPTGELIIRHSVEEIINFGEIEWIAG